MFELRTKIFAPDAVAGVAVDVPQSVVAMVPAGADQFALAESQGVEIVAPGVGRSITARTVAVDSKTAALARAVQGGVIDRAVAKLDALPVMAPARSGAIASLVQKATRVFKRPKLSDYFSAGVIPLFSGEAMQIILDRLKKTDSRSDEDVLTRLNLNLEAYVRSPGTATYGLNAILRDLLRLGLNFEFRENTKLWIIPNPKGAAPSHRPRANVAAAGLDGADRGLVPDERDVILYTVRALLYDGQAAAASDALFRARTADGEDVTGRLARIIDHILPALDYEELAQLFAHAGETQTVVDVIRILRERAPEASLNERHAQLKLIRTLALIPISNGNGVSLTDVLQALLREPTTEEIGVWLIVGANTWGSTAEAERFRKAYDAIPKKPRTWLDYPRVVAEQRLKKFRGNGSESPYRDTPVGQALKLEAELAYYRNGPDGSDSEFIKKEGPRILANLGIEIKTMPILTGKAKNSLYGLEIIHKSGYVDALVALHSKIQSELRARLSEIYLEELADCEAFLSRPAKDLETMTVDLPGVLKDYREKLLSALRSLQDKIDGTAADRVDAALLPRSSAGFLKSLWLKRQDDEMLRAIVAKRDADSQTALEILITRVADLRGLDLEGFDFNQIRVLQPDPTGDGPPKTRDLMKGIRLDGRQAEYLANSFLKNAF